MQQIPGYPQVPRRMPWCPGVTSSPRDSQSILAAAWCKPGGEVSASSGGFNFHDLLRKDSSSGGKAEPCVSNETGKEPLWIPPPPPPPLCTVCTLQGREQEECSDSPRAKHKGGLSRHLRILQVFTQPTPDCSLL
ncbi:hypothetical protein GDO81_008221 [Engystomops pustulosus]|uniref:Prolactin receptor n=1 Tax=Engystomops pustulosus TaxID=76066 RepID=A0AAV7CF08_ENGPU|nr:hypothetical protein GDO81_008221 [Engystomops pustulosus]